MIGKTGKNKWQAKANAFAKSQVSVANLLNDLINKSNWINGMVWLEIADL